MKIVVIGNGMVGQRLLELLAARLPAPLDVTILCEEPRPAYDRVHLTSYFSGKSAADLSLVEPGFFERYGIRIALAERAVAHRPRAAPGSLLRRADLWSTTAWCWPPAPTRSFPPIPGHDRPGCFVYRTIEDLEAIREASAGATTRVWSSAAGCWDSRRRRRSRIWDSKPHVVEFAPRLMAVQIDDAGGRMLRARIAELGVGIHTGRNTVGDHRRHRPTRSACGSRTAASSRPT